MSERVFVHVDASGTGLGNGGLVMLVQLAQELAAMGYKVGIFDHRDRLKPIQLLWLSIEKIGFEIVKVSDVVSSEAPIVSSWLAPIMSEIVSMIRPRRLRYWCNDEILRTDSRNSRAFVLQCVPKIAINNRHLERFYLPETGIGYSGEIIYLDNWIRSDLFAGSSGKIKGSLGYQDDWNAADIFSHLSKYRGQVILCHGAQKAVASKMRRSDFFLFWNRHKDCYISLKGETFGLSLFEAMACGCVCISRAHDGNRFLEGIVPLLDDENDLESTLEFLASDSEEKEECRRSQLDTIETHYRWSDQRREAVLELLD